MKKKTMVWIAVVAIVAVAIGIFIFGEDGKSKQTIAFETVKIARGNVAESITATGTVKPVTEVEVGTQVSGIIDKLYADYNTEVKKGQLIAEMDRVTLNSELQSAQAQYSSAKADFEYQTKLYERNVTLHDKQLISDQDFEQYEYNYLNAKSQLQNTEASLAKARRNLSYATITSPIDGVVISREVEEGQTVAAGFETPCLFVIAADMTQMEVVADVDEADIGGVQEGQRAVFTVDAYPDDTFEGVVKQVRMGSTSNSSSTTTSTVVTYEVVIAASNPDLKLMPRLTADVTIYKNEHDNVLNVPNKALRFTPTKELVGNATVNNVRAASKLWTKEGNVFTAHEVKTGVQGEANTEIISGLPEGTEVILEARIDSGMSELDSLSQRNGNGMFGGPGGGPGGPGPGPR